MPAPIDIHGQTFGFLRVLGKAENYGPYTQWSVVCICGRVFTTQTRFLRNNNVASCGCKSNELRVMNNCNTSHRSSNTPTYKVWQMMKSRCTNPNYTHYSYYGGRGITVCDRWMNSFENFIADMGDRPDGYTIDRIDSNGHYTPTNCRWATRQQQVDNRQNNVYYVHNDCRYSLNQIAEMYGTTRALLYGHMYRGKTLEQAISACRTR